MIAYLYQPKRRRAGRVIHARMYRARIRFEGECKQQDIPLHVTERRSAEQKLQQILVQHDREAVGLIVPKKVREAAETPLREHLRAYLGDLAARGRVPRYVKGVETCVETLATECAWEFLRDITPESFMAWRQGQRRAAKTVNEYLAAARTFLKWAVSLGWLVRSPLESVKGSARRGSPEAGAAGLHGGRNPTAARGGWTSEAGLSGGRADRDSARRRR